MSTLPAWLTRAPGDDVNPSSSSAPARAPRFLEATLDDAEPRPLFGASVAPRSSTAARDATSTSASLHAVPASPGAAQDALHAVPASLGAVPSSLRATQASLGAAQDALHAVPASLGAAASTSAHETSARVDPARATSAHETSARVDPARATSARATSAHATGPLAAARALDAKLDATTVDGKLDTRVEAKLAALGRAVAELDDVAHAQLAQAKSDVVDLAFLVVKQLLGSPALEACRANADVLGAVVDDALTAACATRGSTVRVHPDDVPLVEASGKLRDDGAFKLVADATLTRGDVVVDTDAGRVEATIAGRLARIETALREALTRDTRGGDFSNIGNDMSSRSAA